MFVTQKQSSCSCFADTLYNNMSFDYVVSWIRIVIECHGLLAELTDYKFWPARIRENWNYTEKLWVLNAPTYGQVDALS